jgi:hypothetical protein
MKGILLIACALLMTLAAAHDLTHKEDHYVQGVEWYSRITDSFKLLLWIISSVVVFPVGLLATLIGFPTVYASMYDGVVSGFLKLDAY